MSQQQTAALAALADLRAAILNAIKEGYREDTLRIVLLNVINQTLCPECGTPSPTGEPYATICAKCAESI